MVFNREWIEEDEQLGPQKRTTEVLNGALNCLVDYLRFTTEDHTDFENAKLPTLDCQIWVEGYGIKHEFYEKPQVPNHTLMSDTALSRSCLESSLIQEGVRRLTNTIQDEESGSRNGMVLNKFTKKLINSGFTQEETKSIIIHAVVCFVEKEKRSKLNPEETGYYPLHLSKRFKKEERIQKKNIAKTSWYMKNVNKESMDLNNWRLKVPKVWRTRRLRQRGAEKQKISTVIMVPNTADSLLLDRLVLKEAQLSKITGYAAKLVEGNGTPLCRLFQIPGGSK